MDLVEGWIKLAISDFKVATRLSVYEHRGAIMYHLQQSVEKIIKAIIALLGYEPPRTHFPTKKLEEILFEVDTGESSIRLDKECREIIELIMSIAKTFEDEGTRPRCGIRHSEGIILPDDFYSVDTIKLYYNDARFVLRQFIKLLHKINFCSQRQIACNKLEEVLNYELNES